MKNHKMISREERVPLICLFSQYRKYGMYLDTPPIYVPIHSIRLMRFFTLHNIENKQKNQLSPSKYIHIARYFFE